MFVLIMNDMREPNVENVRAVKVAENRQELVDFYFGELSESYNDGKWGKAFKKGGPLEWYNPVGDIVKIGLFGDGIHEVPKDISAEKAMSIKKYKYSGWNF